MSVGVFAFFLNKGFIYLFLEGEEEREGEKHWHKRETSVGCLSHTPGLGTNPHNPGMLPDWELNEWPFALQNNAQPTELHWSGQNVFAFILVGIYWISWVCSLLFWIHFQSFLTLFLWIFFLFFPLLLVLPLCRCWCAEWFSHISEVLIILVHCFFSVFWLA